MKYLQCERRPADMTYVAWLRSFRTDVPVPRPYARVRGQAAAVAVIYASRMSDAFYGQWLCAWLPWNTPPQVRNQKLEVLGKRKGKRTSNYNSFQKGERSGSELASAFEVPASLPRSSP